MRTKQFIIGISAAALLWISAPCAWAGDRFDRIQDRQADRIYEGVRSGRISEREYDRLVEEQMRIERARVQALEDEHLTRNERIRLQKMQDRAGRHIYGAKRNPDQRNGNYGHNRWNYSPGQSDYRPGCRYK